MRTVRPLFIAIICMAISLAGCQTMRPVDISTNEPLITKLAPKDSVRVWMRDGRTMDLILTEVERDALISGENRLPLKDMERVERRGISWTRTTLLLVGIGFVVLLAYTAAEVQLASACC